MSQPDRWWYITLPWLNRNSYLNDLLMVIISMVNFRTVLVVLAVVLVVRATDATCKGSMEDAKVAAEKAFTHISDGKSLDLLVEALQEMGIKLREHESICNETLGDIYDRISPLLPKSCSKEGR